MLQLQPHTTGVVDQGDRTSGTAEEIDTLRQPGELIGRDGIRHLEVVETALRQARETCLGQIAHIEVGMQPKTEGHGGIAAVLNGGGDLQRIRDRPQLHFHPEGKGIGRQGGLAAGQTQPHPVLIVKQLQLPGKIASEPMLFERVVDAIYREHIPRQIPTDGKQHRNATANALGGVGVALLIEVQQLPSATTPTADQSPTFGDDPQLISAGGMHEVPVVRVTAG